MDHQAEELDTKVFQDAANNADHAWILQKLIIAQKKLVPQVKWPILRTVCLKIWMT